MSSNSSKGIALTALALSTILSGCNKTPSLPAIQLPADLKEAAATCYAATLMAAKGEVDAKQANAAGQYLYLGIVNDGIAEQSALPALVQAGEALRPTIEKAGNASAYAEACTKKFPSTAPGSAKPLPADDRNVRMMCLTLSTAMLQTFQSSGITPPADVVAVNAKLDESLRAEINAAGNINPAEIAGMAMRSMAKAVEYGPTEDVLKACGERYGGS